MNSSEREEIFSLKEIFSYVFKGEPKRIWNFQKIQEAFW